MKDHLFPVIVECLDEGGYYAECPLLQGCHVEGRTYAQAIQNLQDAIDVILDSYRDLGKKLPHIPRIHRRAVVTSGIPVPLRKAL